MTEHVFVFSQYATHVVTVEHDGDRDAAEQLAYDELPGSLCHQCAHDFEMAGDWELVPEDEDEDKS